jgi:hypothetical protein
MVQVRRAGLVMTLVSRARLISFAFTEADQQHVADHVRVNVLRAASHVLLFEARHAFADRCLDLTLCLHD